MLAESWSANQSFLKQRHVLSLMLPLELGTLSQFTTSKAKNSHQKLMSCCQETVPTYMETSCWLKESITIWQMDSPFIRFHLCTAWDRMTCNHSQIISNKCSTCQKSAAPLQCMGHCTGANLTKVLDALELFDKLGSATWLNACLEVQPT